MLFHRFSKYISMITELKSFKVKTQQEKYSSLEQQKFVSIFLQKKWRPLFRIRNSFPAVYNIFLSIHFEWIETYRCQQLIIPCTILWTMYHYSTKTTLNRKADLTWYDWVHEMQIYKHFHNLTFKVFYAFVYVHKMQWLKVQCT